jgi:DNA phosphorothioation-dependent restriction protein DptH
MMNEAQVGCLQDALKKLLGKPSEGTMAYVRCLASEVVAELGQSPAMKIPGWDIYVVVDNDGRGGAFITADQAVNLREEKRGSILLLVDVKAAGAGMDGIYSAVREIGEGELITLAISQAMKLMPRDVKDFAQAATRQAKSLGRTHVISPWREFEFYARCASEPHEAGRHVAILGLWPILPEGELKKEDTQISAQVVERLLLAGAANLTVRARVESLLLDEEDKFRQLEKFLRETTGLRWTEAVIEACDRPDIWLNSIKPGFVNQDLRGIELVPWRSGPTAAPYRWSGLTAGEENTPVFTISDQGQERAKLVVRWKSLPRDLKAGAADYRVSIITGSESELVSRQVGHTGKDTQQCVFTGDDFEELDEGGKWEAKVRVQPVGAGTDRDEEAYDSPLCKESETFILTFGTVDVTPRSSVGKKARALVEEAIKLPTAEEFELACRAPVTEDAQGYLSFKLGGKGGRAYRPPLIKAVEEDWRERGYQVGRWSVRVRADGSLAGSLTFVAYEQGACDAEVWKRLEDSTRQMGQRALERGGFIGLIHHGNETIIANYVNAWVAVLDVAAPQLALAHTVEVQSLAGDTLGLIVLPSHPLRVAWHQAYDELAFRCRYEEGLKPAEIVRTLGSLDGSFIPSFLPGLSEKTSFVFGDSLGFYAVAMIRDDEREPQATIAQMVRCLSTLREDAAPSVGRTTASAIAREVDKYIDLHPQYGILRLNALRPGDGLTIARALGLTLIADREDEESAHPRPGYVLDLFPSEGASDPRLVGRYLSETAERRRAGAGAVAPEDRWMLETYEINGMTMPRLKWAKRNSAEPEVPAHLSVAFDTFDSVVETIPEDGIVGPRPIEAFGLIPSMLRQFTFRPTPTWTTTVAPSVEGEKHPVARSLSERLQRLHSAVLHAVSANLGGDKKSWPVLRTQLLAEQEDSVRRLHELSDWVVTVDRNAGIEYFDAPREAEDVYDTYVIDCVPERQDLDSVQLVTSTSNIEEVMRLLDQTLNDMALSCSPRNCNFLLSRLKAISGRLAMRLANRGQGRGEMIALAMFYDRCAGAAGEKDWLPLDTGFIVPLDDVRELLLDEKETATEGEEIEAEGAGNLRADLVYVDLSRRGALQFTFVEIKYRRLLRSARDNRLFSYVCEQTSKTRKRWMDIYFSTVLTQTQMAIRRKRLARALHFYLEKARRHHLPEQVADRLASAIDGLFRSSTEIASELIEDRAYIFCPEYTGAAAEIAYENNTRVYLFGPQGMPDSPVPPAMPEPGEATLPSQQDSLRPLELDATPGTPDSEATTIVDQPADESVRLASIDDSQAGQLKTVQEVKLLLGNTATSDDRVTWNMSITGNPHLMIVGLPGMGKTTCIINLCEQLWHQGVTPLVFSYHDDIETKLRERLGELNLVDIDNGLGFNPLRVVGHSHHGWLDNVGMVRDIFAAVYSDLGDLQTNEIREAIKQSYTELGYGLPDTSAELPIPLFQRFFEILKQKPRPNPGLMARLEELNDYGFFRSTGEYSSLLECRQPTIIRLYATQNEVLQNAVSSFVLLNLYQNMFMRGAQTSLTHAIVFDEAHRASRLKLLPAMAKECRKFGLALIVASQEAKDFSPSLYAAVANYLVLRVTEADAKALAKNVANSSEASNIAGRLKQLAKFTALFFAEGRRPSLLKLLG